MPLCWYRFVKVSIQLKFYRCKLYTEHSAEVSGTNGTASTNRILDAGLYEKSHRLYTQTTPFTFPRQQRIRSHKHTTHHINTHPISTHRISTVIIFFTPDTRKIGKILRKLIKKYFFKTQINDTNIGRLLTLTNLHFNVLALSQKCCTKK